MLGGMTMALRVLALKTTHKNSGSHSPAGKPSEQPQVNQWDFVEMLETGLHCKQASQYLTKDEQHLSHVALYLFGSGQCRQVTPNSWSLCGDKQQGISRTYTQCSGSFGTTWATSFWLGVLGAVVAWFGIKLRLIKVAGVSTEVQWAAG